MFDADDVVDDEGRPVNERRAPSRVKQGVPIELRRCPYRDERRGKPMNVSALAQITRYLPRTLSEIESFTSALDVDGYRWQALLPPLVHLLIGPVRHLLSSGAERVPAQLAVGHKLAAGFFGVVTGLITDELEGNRREVNVENLLAFTHERHLLLGASEVCAGPPPMIRQATQALLNGAAAPFAPDSVSREQRLATAIARQIVFGLSWECYDIATERSLLRDLSGPLEATPKNDYIRLRLQRRTQELSAADSPRGVLLPKLPSDAAYDAMSQQALRLLAKAPAPRLVSLLLDVLRCEDGAIVLPEASRQRFAERVAEHLEVHRTYLLASWGQERLARAELNLSPETPLKPNAVVLPKPRTEDWFEAVLGHRFRFGAQPDFGVVAQNHCRSIALETQPPPATLRSASVGRGSNA